MSKFARELEGSRMDDLKQRNSPAFSHDFHERGFEAAPKCNDACFAILFFLHVVALAAVFTNFASNVQLNSEIQSFVGLALICIVLGICGSYLYMNVCLRNCPSTIINISIGLNVALVAAFTIYSFAIGSVYVGILMGFVFCFLCYYWYIIQSRIPFAVTLIRIALQIVSDNNGLWYAAIGTVIAMLSFAALWGLSLLGYLESTRSNDSSMSYAALIGFVFSGYWGYEVIRYVLFATACGVSASWILQPDSPRATSRSFMRAAVWSFGSICFGAFLLSAIRTIEFVARYMANNRDSDNALMALVSCIFICILRCVEEILEYINEFGFAFVSIYGMSYCAACKSVLDLLKGTGFESIIQFDLSETALWMGCILIGLLSCLTTYLYTISQGSALMQENKVLVAIGGFMLAFGIVFVVTMIVKGAIITTFVVWAMEPAKFANSRTKEMVDLQKATEELAVGGYMDMDLANRLNETRHQPDQRASVV